MVNKDFQKGDQEQHGTETDCRTTRQQKKITKPVKHYYIYVTVYCFVYM